MFSSKPKQRLALLVNQLVVPGSRSFSRSVLPEFMCLFLSLHQFAAKNWPLCFSHFRVVLGVLQFVRDQTHAYALRRGSIPLPSLT